MRKRKVYKNVLVKALKDLSDIDFQKIAWFENDQALSSSFADDVNAVFDDTGLEIALKNNEIIFGKAADVVLHELGKAIDAVNEFRPEEEIINDPLMQVVREKAAKALELIKASDGSESTVEIIE